jgi:hypothetical protein
MVVGPRVDQFLEEFWALMYISYSAKHSCTLALSQLEAGSCAPWPSIGSTFSKPMQWGSRRDEVAPTTAELQDGTNGGSRRWCVVQEAQCPQTVQTYALTPEHESTMLHGAG